MMNQLAFQAVAFVRSAFPGAVACGSCPFVVGTSDLVRRACMPFTNASP